MTSHDLNLPPVTLDEVAQCGRQMFHVSARKSDLICVFDEEQARYILGLVSVEVAGLAERCAARQPECVVHALVLARSVVGVIEEELPQVSEDQSPRMAFQLNPPAETACGSAKVLPSVGPQDPAGGIVAKIKIGASKDFPNPDKHTEAGWSNWIENGVYFKAPTVDSGKFGPHAYDGNGYDNGIRSCACGCYMGSCNSSGPVDPFGACPKNPI